MCLMEQDSNNLDTEDLIIFTNLLARFDDLATAIRKDSTGNPFRRLSLVILNIALISFAQLHT